MSKQGFKTMRDIPNEIAIQIVEYLSHKKDLYHVCQLSKRFHAIAEPLLYEHVSLSSLQIHLLKPLMSFLLERPDLALKIKVFQIYPHPFRHDSYNHYPVGEHIDPVTGLFTLSVHRKMQQAIESTAPEDEEVKMKLYGQVMSRGVGNDIAIAVILFLAENVERVGLCDEWIDEFSDFDSDIEPEIP